MTSQNACKLCFKESKDFQVIDEIIREVLDVLLLKTDFSLNEDSVNYEQYGSRYRRGGLFEGKSRCCYRSDSDDAVCRLCLKRDLCVDLNAFSENFADDILAKCIPEVDMKSTRDPKICLSCQTSLLNYYRFVTECLAKQENVVEHDDREVIKLEELNIKTEEEEYDGLYKWLKAYKLCFKESKDFQVIDEIIREILDVLLLKIDFALNEDSVVCESCADSINTFFKFKSVCLCSEGRLVPFIRAMNGMKVDIVEVVYLMENPGAATSSDSDGAVCRLCLKRDRCVDLNDFIENIANSCQMYSRSCK
ncbi:hypothetical protein NQ318_000086 [Aromia moschata]|uniref:ZAD domain-containing protein n=1 Tax=Aromia moschata TaxID=1265417 RepID=A0AAV8YDB6_9CUCU|nr:hypothetical protein NQ318_000086 [Aromia moschata]